MDEPLNGTLSNDHTETGYITYRPDVDFQSVIQVIYLYTEPYLENSTQKSRNIKHVTRLENIMQLLSSGN